MVVTLHHLDQSRSQRIIWLLEELGIEYEVKVYMRQGGLAPKELKQIHPLGKSPVITDGPLTVAESGAIVEYLIKKYGNGRFTVPEGDEQKQLDNNYFTHFAEGSLMPPLVMKLVFTSMYTKSPFFIKPVVNMITGSVNSAFLDPNLRNMFEMIDGYLQKDGGRDWLAGGSEPTAADFLMIFPIEAGVNGGRLDPSWVTPRVQEYLKRCQDRPCYVRALEKGPPYAYGPKL